MGFPQDMGIWRCDRCNSKIKEPFYVGEDMMCEACHKEFQAGFKRRYENIKEDITAVINRLNRIMEEDESGYEMSTAEIRLNDALSAIEKELENGIQWT